MTMYNTTLRSGIALAALSLAACGSLNQTQHSLAEQPVEIKFAAEINGQAFRCGQQYAGVGTTGSTLTPSDLRFFVSEVHLLRADGTAVPVALAQDQVWQQGSLALLDFENGTGACQNGTMPTNTSVRGTAPAGQYTGLRFTLGVPFEKNHGDPTVATSPLNLTAMFWNWQGGYKFVKFDAASSGQGQTTAAPDARGGGNASGFSVHLGSTQCASESRTQPPSACRNPNRPVVTFQDFNPTRHTVVLDMGRVLAGANVDVNTPNTSPGCMSFPNDPECPTVMAAFGLPYMEAAAPAQQSAFSVR